MQQASASDTAGRPTAASTIIGPSESRTGHRRFVAVAVRGRVVITIVLFAQNRGTA